MKYTLLILGFAFFAPSSILSAEPSKANGYWNDHTPVSQVLKELDDPMPAHYVQERDEQAVNRGEQITKYSYSIGPDGTKSKLQSRYFTCINCHNIRKEDPDLRVSDPDARLDYAIQNKLPFLPGTTLYGVVNRTSWFNDDYLKKYGDVASEANKDLVKAIQLCASQCSMGRKLDEWELQSVLAYLWSIELKLGDLNLSEADWKKLKQATIRPNDYPELAPWLKGHYLKASSAAFRKVPKIKNETTDGYKGDIKNGKAIYVLGCLSCHKSSGVTSFILGNSKVTYQLLNEHTDHDASFSIYDAIRNGIKANPGKGYMPNFPLQRMSDRQMGDLRTFIRYQATHNPVSLRPFEDWTALLSTP